jgi:hypothetical protein
MDAVIAIVMGLLVPIALGLLLLIFAARLVTRVVLDELRKDHQRRGPM